MANSVVQTIRDAEVDARSLSEFVYKPANFMVSRRLAPPINTLQYYIDKANSVNDAFSKLVSDATAATDMVISAANTANQNAIGLIDSVTNQASQSVQNAISGVAVDANLVTDALTTIVPMSSGAIARTQLDKNRENISVLDFFTKAELTAYKANQSTFDAYRPLQAFFDYISANDVGTANVSGKFSTAQPIVFSRSSTDTVVGSLNLTALKGMDTLFTLAAGPYFRWVGKITLRGTGSHPIASRTCRVGLRISTEASSSSRVTIDKIYISFFSEAGVLASPLTTASNLGDVHASYCGCGNAYGFNSTYTTSELLGGISTAQQKTVLVVKSIPDFPTVIPAYMLAVLGDDIFLVDSIDKDLGTITIHGWQNTLDYKTASGNISFFWGAGLYIHGGDSSVLTVNSVDATGCGAGVLDTSLYGTIINSVIAQSCGIGFQVGERLGQAHLGGSVGAFYNEGNTFSLVRVTRAALSMNISTIYGHFWERIRVVGKVRASSTTINKHLYNDLIGISVRDGNYLYKYSRHGSRDISFIDEETTIINAGMEYLMSLNLIEPSDSSYYLFNKIACSFKVFGNGYRGAPNSVKVSAPTGYTLNGTEDTSIIFSEFKGVANFIASCDKENKVMYVYLYDDSGNVYGKKPYTEVLYKTLDAPVTIEPGKYDHSSFYFPEPLKTLDISVYSDVKGIYGREDGKKPLFTYYRLYNATNSPITLPIGTKIKFTVVRDALIVPNPLSSPTVSTLATEVIAAGAMTEKIITVNGAALGDFVNVAYSKGLGGLQSWAEVSSANKVTVRISNQTRADITLPEVVMSIKVSKA